MGLLKKVSLALFVSVAMLATASTAIAKPAGKIENATGAETIEAIDKTLELSKATLAAITDGTDKEAVMDMFKKTKQSAKTIESTVTYMLREKSLGKLSKARTAYNHGDLKTAEAEMIEADQSFQLLSETYRKF